MNKRLFKVKVKLIGPNLQDITESYTILALTEDGAIYVAENKFRREVMAKVTSVVEEIYYDEEVPYSG